MAIEASPRRLDRLVREVERELRENLEREEPVMMAAQLGREMMIRRTRQGIDRLGRIFRYYRPSTAKRKGRRSPVDLTESGRMLEGLHVRPEGFWMTGRRADIYFRHPRDKRIARYHIEGTRKMAKRDFFGFTPREEEQLATIIRGGVRRSVPKDRRRRINISLFSA